MSQIGSLKLAHDGPELLNVSAFKQANSDDYAITWRRRQDRIRITD